MTDHITAFDEALWRGESKTGARLAGTIDPDGEDRLGDRRAVARETAATAVIDEDGTPLLLHAAESLHAELVADLLDRGAAVDAGDRFGGTKRFAHATWPSRACCWRAAPT